VAVVDEPIVIGRRFYSVIWLLLKSWCLGLLVFAFFFAILFISETDRSLPTFAPINLVVGFVMSFLFLLLAATVFTLPLTAIAGLLAHTLHNHIWRHPRITTLIAPIVGLVIFQATTHVFSHPTDEGLIDALSKEVISIEGIATLIALTASTAYYSFTLRVKMLGMKDEKSS
jgi:hypothetical protein